MKKVLALMVMCFMVMGAVKAFADSRSDALNIDPRFIDDMDNIWFYPNMVNEFKNTVDFRTAGLNATRVWGGFLDGEHTGLGVVGAYVYRPNGYDGTRGWNFNSPGWYGVGQGWNGNYNMFANMYPAGYTGHWLITAPENKVDLFWGTSFDKGNFGVQVNYADAEGLQNSPQFGNPDQVNSNSATAAGDATQTTSNDVRVLGANLGLGLNDVGPFGTLDIHAGYYMGMLNDSETNVRNAAGTGNGTTYNNTLKDNGIGTIALGALGDAKLDDNGSLRVFADAYIDNNAQTEHLTRDDNTTAGLHNDANDRDETFSGKYSDIVATLGFGCNHKVLDGKATISSGLQAFWINTDQVQNPYVSQDGAAANTTTVNGVNLGLGNPFDEWKQDLWDIAWNASVEAKVASWLTARAGINRPIIYRTANTYIYNTYLNNAVVSTAKTQSNNDSYFGNSGSTYSLGFGVNFENWTIDCTTSVGSVFNTIGNVNPGNGLLFSNGASIVTNTDAGISYKF